MIVDRIKSGPGASLVVDSFTKLLVDADFGTGMDCTVVHRNG